MAKPWPVALAVGLLSAQANVLEGWNMESIYRDIDMYIPSMNSSDVEYPKCEVPAGSGEFTGICIKQHRLKSMMTFCRDTVDYDACVPPHQPLFPEWNVTTKDALLRRLYKEQVEFRISVEMNITVDNAPVIRFTQNSPCLEAFRKVLCWFNFPRCSTSNVSMPLCRTACSNYYQSCKYEKIGAEYDACKDEVVKTKGLFESGLTGTTDVLLDQCFLEDGTGDCCTGSSALSLLSAMLGALLAAHLW
mmetsp:Transcript_63623/g.170430  ORF Transcript_63623/g.170430 Transcript_63623/m.170430 type:complete len:247 (-) Transcript_63623:98-838(-)